MRSLLEYGKVVAANKSYRRSDLMELYNDVGNHAILVSFHLAYKDDDCGHVTFYNVRVLDNNGIPSRFQLADHINIRRDIVEKYIALEPKQNFKKFFAVCVPHTYLSYGTVRAGLSLVEVDDEVPLIEEPLDVYVRDATLHNLVRLRIKYNLLNGRSGWYNTKQKAIGGVVYDYR